MNFSTLSGLMMDSSQEDWHYDLFAENAIYMPDISIHVGMDDDFYDELDEEEETVFDWLIQRLGGEKPGTRLVQLKYNASVIISVYVLECYLADSNTLLYIPKLDLENELEGKLCFIMSEFNPIFQEYMSVTKQ